jgi:hypothetical protein
MDKNLFLPLAAVWYDKIKSGEKTTEYRELKPYWMKRLNVKSVNILGKKNSDGPERRPASINWNSGLWPDFVIFSRGYTSERICFEISGVSVVPGINSDLKIDAPVFAIKLGKRIYEYEKNF